MTYRFLGTESEHANVIMRDFGMKVEFDRASAEEAILGGCALIPDSEFAKLGFTEEEIAQFVESGSHPDAPPAFLAKKRAALKLVHAFRQPLEDKLQADRDAHALALKDERERAIAETAAEVLAEESAAQEPDVHQSDVSKEEV